MPRRWILLPILLLTAITWGKTKGEDLVHVRMVTDCSAITPGKPFRVGIVYDITPGWHIYWTNPGDAGTPTKVSLHVPAGFRVDPWQYPVPVKFEMPGGIVCYGYHTQVMLMATLTPPADLKPGQEVTISAQTNYLVCQEVCLSGKQELSHNVLVSKVSDSRNYELFKHWSSLIPIPADQSPLVKSIESDASSATIHWKKMPTNVQFFPGTSPAVSIENVTVLNLSNRTQILFSPKVYDKSTLGAIACVVGYFDPHGVHRAIEFAVYPRPE